MNKSIVRGSGKYKALPKISRQKFNEYIKECCQIAGCSPDIIKKHYVSTDWEMENEAMEKAFEKH